MPGPRPNRQSDVELVIARPLEDVLLAIDDATARESLPFISTVAYPQELAKQFVAKRWGNRFRVWRVPSATRRRQNVCMPYLHGTVTAIPLGSVLRGSFALHPFNRVQALLPLVALGFVWVVGDMGQRGRLVLGLVSIVVLAIELSVILASRRLCSAEEGDIVRFLQDLFPDVSAVTGGR